MTAGKKLIARELPPHPPNPIVLLYWARELVEAEAQLRDARSTVESVERRREQLAERLRSAVREHE